MRKIFPLLLVLPFASTSLHAQRSVEGGLPTQALVRSESKDSRVIDPAMLNIEINGKSSPLTSLQPVVPGDVQVALLIDDGLSRSAGIQLNDLRAFARSLPPQVELMVGYMSNGRILVTSPFTTDHQAAARAIRLPFGIPGQSASPYFCLSDFVKKWPGSQADVEEGPVRGHKARFVMMITNGVDPYNGSTSILNQDSPYVQAAVDDAQRAGVAVSSIYYRDSGFRGGGASFSGQSYLEQVAQGTGGTSYYQGTFNPVSLKPFLQQYTRDISETYIATFPVNAQSGGRSQLVRLKMKSSQPRLKLRHPDEVRPGNMEVQSLQ